MDTAVRETRAEYFARMLAAYEAWHDAGMPQGCWTAPSGECVSENCECTSPHPCDPQEA